MSDPSRGRWRWTRVNIINQRCYLLLQDPSRGRWQWTHVYYYYSALLFLIIGWMIPVAAVGSGLLLIPLISAAICYYTMGDPSRGRWRWTLAVLIPVAAVGGGLVLISLVSAAICYYRMGDPSRGCWRWTLVNIINQRCYLLLSEGKFKT